MKETVCEGYLVNVLVFDKKKKEVHLYWDVLVPPGNDEVTSVKLENQDTVFAWMKERNQSDFFITTFGSVSEVNVQNIPISEAEQKELEYIFKPTSKEPVKH
tara:strand:- start:24702 stop:25007 length:306 start_codon:yes stop_codon:yes gene_type:complete